MPTPFHLGRRAFLARTFTVIGAAALIPVLAACQRVPPETSPTVEQVAPTRPAPTPRPSPTPSAPTPTPFPTPAPVTLVRTADRAEGLRRSLTPWWT